MVWEMLMQMEWFHESAKVEDQRAVALVLDLEKGIRASQLSCSLGLGDAFQLPPGSSCGCFAGISNTRVECSLKVVRQSHCKPFTAILPGFKWSCLLLRIVLQDALSEVTKKKTSVEVEGFCRWHHGDSERKK